MAELGDGTVKPKTKKGLSMRPYDPNVHTSASGLETGLAKMKLKDSKVDKTKQTRLKPSVQSKSASYDLLHLPVSKDKLANPLHTPASASHEEKQLEIQTIEQELATDLFKTPEYARDIYLYLQKVEKRWNIPQGFLEDGEINPKIRAVLMDWLIQIQVYLELFDITLHMAVMLVDRFLHLQKIGPSSLQLLGITCVLISAKYYERFPPQVSDLCYLTDNTYKVDQVFIMERIVLRKFRFDINTTDPVAVQEHFLQLVSCDKNCQNMAKYLLDLTLTCDRFVSYSPTMKAAASVFVARKILVPDQTWTFGLEYFSGYTEKDLRDCVKEMLTLLISAPEASLQGAREKYETKTFGRISHHRHLKTKPAEILAAMGVPKSIKKK